MNRGLPFSVLLGFAAVVVVMAGRARSETEPPQPAQTESTQTEEAPDDTQDLTLFGKGEALLAAFFGTPDVGHASREFTRFDFDVILAAVPDPYESSMDWIYDALLAAMQRAFETGGLVLDRYWIPGPGDSVADPDAVEAQEIPERRIHPGVLLFRRWDPEHPDSLSLRLLYLVGEVPTRGVHVRALEAALAERDSLLRMFSPPPPVDNSGRDGVTVDETPGVSSRTREAPEQGGVGSDSRSGANLRQDTVKILGPVFSGSSFSWRRALDRLLPEDSQPGVRIRFISGSATSPGNKRTLESPGGRMSFRATVNSDRTLMNALEPLILGPLGIDTAEVAILQESNTAYGRGIRQEAEQDFLYVPFPMSISLLRSEYAQLPTMDDPTDLIPQVSEGPRVPVSLQERARSPETPATVSALTAPALEVVLEEITRTLKTRGAKAVGLMATDVRDKVFLGNQIHRRLPDVQLFTLESNVLMRAGEYREALRGMMVISTYTLSLGNQGRIPGGGLRERVSFANDGAQGVYNATLIHLGVKPEVVGYQAPEKACRAADGQDGSGNAAPWPPSRPPVWLSAVGNTSLVPISCWIPPGADEYVARARGRGEPAPFRSEGRSVLSRGVFVILVLAIYLFSAVILWKSTLRKESESEERERKAEAAERAAGSPPGSEAPGSGTGVGAEGGEGDGEKKELGAGLGQKGRISDDGWPLQRGSHLIHLGIYRGLLLIALGGLLIPLAFPPPYLLETVFVLLPLVAVVVWEARRSLLLLKKWTGPGARFAEDGLRITGKRLKKVREETIGTGTGDSSRVVRSAHRTAGWFVARCESVLGWGVARAGRIGAWARKKNQRQEDHESSAVGSPGAAPKEMSSPDPEGGGRGRGGGGTREGADEPTWQGPIWVLEILARTLVAVAGVGLFVLLLWHGLEVEMLARRAPGAFALYVQRAEQWGSGLSPLTPLTLGLMGVVAWCGWHWVRIEILLCIRPFEDSCFPREGNWAWGEDLAGIPNAWTEAWRRVEGGIRELRTRLFLLIPDVAGLLFAAFLLVAGAWLGMRIGPTLERAAVDHAGNGFYIWPLLFRMLVISAILITSWSVYRLISIWSTLKRVLESVLETPLVPAFDRLPRRVARFTRLAVFERASRTMLGSMAGTQWKQMQRLHALVTREGPDPGAASTEELPVRVRDEMTRLMNREIGDSFLEAERSKPAGKTLSMLRRILLAQWALEPGRETVGELKSAFQKGPDGHQSNTTTEIRTRFTGRLGLWTRIGEEFLACQMVGYIGWALNQVRWLAVFLVSSLLFTTALISSYPFQNQGEVKVFFFFVAVGGIVALIATLIQMNRNDLLSRINGSDPNRVTWNARFFVNLMVFGAVPLLALLSSTFPPLRNLLAAWIGPLSSMLTSF